MVTSGKSADQHGPLLLLPALLLSARQLLLNSLRPDVRNFMGTQSDITAMPVPILSPSTSTILPTALCGESDAESVRLRPQSPSARHDLIGRD